MGLIKFVDRERVIFVLPWLQHVVVGTTDVHNPADPMPTPSAAEVNQVLRELASVMQPNAVSAVERKAVHAAQRSCSKGDSCAPRPTTDARVRRALGVDRVPSTHPQNDTVDRIPAARSRSSGIAVGPHHHSGRQMDDVPRPGQGCRRLHREPLEGSVLLFSVLSCDSLPPPHSLARWLGARGAVR